MLTFIICIHRYSLFCFVLLILHLHILLFSVICTIYLGEDGAPEPLTEGTDRSPGNTDHSFLSSDISRR